MCIFEYLRRDAWRDKCSHMQMLYSLSILLTLSDFSGELDALIFVYYIRMILKIISSEKFTKYNYSTLIQE